MCQMRQHARQHARQHEKVRKQLLPRLTAARGSRTLPGCRARRRSELLVDRSFRAAICTNERKEGAQQTYGRKNGVRLRARAENVARRSMRKISPARRQRYDGEASAEDAGKCTEMCARIGRCRYVGHVPRVACVRAAFGVVEVLFAVDRNALNRANARSYI